MNTRFKMVLSGIMGGAVVIIAIAGFLAIHNLWQGSAKSTTASNPSVAATAPDDSNNVIITVVPDTHANSVQQNQIYEQVQQLLQNPAATSFDASGFVQYVYSKAGVQLPRTIAQQAQAGTSIPSPDQLEKGDLVFFNLDASGNSVTFDGIYLGNNQFAAVTGHGLKSINLNDPYWIGKFVYGRRVN